MDSAHIKSFSIFFTFLIFSFVALAQQTGKGKISGRVTDSLTRGPVDFATISIFKPGSTSPVNGISADAKGNYTVTNLPFGTYKVTIDFLGYKRKTVDGVVINEAKPNITLGNVLLVPSQTQLNTVRVIGQAPVIENKIDKLVYNAESDLTAQGGMALDVLKKVPMVNVDIDGNVELQGSTSIRFLINGKPSTIFGASLADALQSIPASQIKNIEVITSPGAKYDAQGTGGIINIVLKKSTLQGFNGSVNLAAGTRLENGSVNLNLRKGNIGINTFFNGNEQLNTTGLSSSQRTSYSNNRDSLTNLYQNGSSSFKRNGYQTGFSVNWAITKKDELTADISYHRSSNLNSGFNSQDQTITRLPNTLLSELISMRNSYSNSHNHSTDMSLEYKKTFKKEGQELGIHINSSHDSNNSDVFQRQDYSTLGKTPSGTQSNNPGKESETTFAIDYAHPLTEEIMIEGGIKSGIETINSTSVTDTLSTNGNYVTDPNQVQSINYRRYVNAGYASVSAELFHKFFELKAGLRYERTATSIANAAANVPGYNTFAPSYVLLHKFDKSQSLKFSYSFRIERPDYGDVNPFYNVSDPHNISTGNPNLKPELGHNYELGYSKSFKSGGNVYFAAVYRYNTDDIQGITTYYDILNINGKNYPSVTLSQRTNIGSQKQVGANIFGSVPVTGKLTLRSNIQAGNRSNSNPGYATVSSFAYRVNLNAAYEFSNSLTAEIFGNYNSKQTNIQSTRPGFGSYNVAVRKQFFNKKASIGLTAANPFSEYVNQTTTSFGSNFNQTSLRQVPYRSFGITISYKFGKVDFKKEKDDQPIQQSLPDQN